ncbi:MAG: endolytic transglycosylase MltG [Culturomica sp.]|jgi:UPF0755 protein|nr:endolytic transglycosylase MltG [Culturomica sp.]
MKKLKYIVSILLIFFFVVCGTIYYLFFYPNTAIKYEADLYINKKDAFPDVLNKLRIEKLLKNTVTFKIAAKLSKYDNLVKPGRYVVRGGMSNYDLIKMLRSGEQTPVEFTFNNLRTLAELASTLSQQLDVDSVEFMGLVKDTSIVNELGFNIETIPAMFIPNTYQLYMNISEEEFLRRMKKEYVKFWNDKRTSKAAEAGLSTVEVTILASIVEEETLKPKEFPVVAGVYINRLRKGIPLAACPTLKYAWNDFTIKRVLKKHLQIDSPYNTYKHKGLPPGPVRIPSVQVIDSVLNYSKHNYLFFCAKSDFSGEHYFSKTLREHNNYANEYHHALNDRKIFK